MLHAWMLTQSGIPVLYSGDEVARLNDYSYHTDPEKWEDSRYVHRGRFDWEATKRRNDPLSREGHIFRALRQLEQIRAARNVFRADAKVSAFYSGSDQVLGVHRSYDGNELFALFNFCEESRTVNNPARGVADLVSGQTFSGENLILPGYGFVWLKTR